MKSRNLKFIALLTALLIMLASAAQADKEAEVRAKIRDATKKFRDLTMDVKITYANQKELAVIGTDYGKAYEFENSKLFFKVPDMFRMTARVGLVSVNYIVRGNAKIIRAGIIKKTDDISKSPHKKQTALDVGVVSDSLWKEFSVDYVRSENYLGRLAHVLSLFLSNSPSKKQYIWVDAKDFRLLKREKHEADKSLRVRYIYSKHKEYKDAVWVPGEVKVYNQNGKLGGTSVYTNVQVNTGISDKEFQ